MNQKSENGILALWGDWGAAGVRVADFGNGAVSSQLRAFSNVLKRCCLRIEPFGERRT